MGLDIDLYTPKIDIGDDGADDIIIEITGLKSISKFIGLEDTPLYYDNGKFFKVEDNKIVYANIQWKDISGDISESPEIVAVISDLVNEVASDILDERINLHNLNEEAHPYIQDIINQNYNTLNTKIDDTKEELSEALNTEITNRETADNELSESLQQETLARIETDTTLQNNINILTNNLSTETENRISADNLLRDDIDNISGGLAQEIINRQTQDNLLQEQITSNYTTLNTKIDNTKNNLDNDILNLSNTVSSNYTTLDTKINNTKTSLEGDISDLSTTVSNNYTTLDGKITNLTSTVNDNYTELDGRITTNTNNISTINSKIPNQASSSNQLADKDFVNSSIATNTANFIGTFNSVAELEAYSGTLTNNDYAFVATIDSAGNTLYDRYKYSTYTQEWLFEYELNNSSFTAVQWASINSGATTENINQIAINTNNITDLQTNKQDKLTAGANIQINNNVISATDTTYTAGSGISIENNVISNTQTSAVWGNIQGTLSNQIDLQNVLNSKQNNLVSGQNIKTINLTSILGSGDISVATSAQGALADTALQPNDNISELTNDANYITSEDLPVVNNGVLTIQVNGDDLATFSANQSGNTTANIVVPDSATWGNITGTLSDQLDLQEALDGKQKKLTQENAGQDIAIIPESSKSASGNDSITFVSDSNDLNSLVVEGKCEYVPEAYLDSVILDGATELKVPGEYTQVEYLESDGSQYIDTGIVLKSEATIETVAELTQINWSAGPYSFWGFMATGTTPRWGWSVYQNRWLSDLNSTTQVYSPVVDRNKHTFTNTCYYSQGERLLYDSIVDGVSVYEAPKRVDLVKNYTSNTLSAYIFARNTANTAGNFIGAKIYSYKITQDGILVLNLIPCRRNSDSVLGMYDTVTGNFLTNAGTGTFTAGADVTPTPNKPMDIVCNNGVVKVSPNVLQGEWFLNQSRTSATGILYSLSDAVASDIFPVQSNTTYTVCYNGVANFARWYEYDANKSYITDSFIANSKIITTSSDTKYISVSFMDSQLSNVITQEKYKLCSVNSGDVALPFMPYKKAYTDGTIETVEDSLGNTATAEMLLSVGNYKDAQSVLDGVVTRNVGIKVLDGSESWNYYSVTQGNMFRIQIAESVSNEKDVLGVLCNCYTVIGTGQRTNNTLSGTSKNYDFINNNYTNLTDWRAYLAQQYAQGTPVIIVYPLETATTETVSSQFLSKSPVTQTAGSIDNLPITITELSHTVPTLLQPLNIRCNNGTLSADSLGNITVTGDTETLEIDTTGDTATVENLFGVEDYKDSQSILDGVVTRNCEAILYDGTQTINTPYISTTGGLNSGSIIVYAKDTSTTETVTPQTLTIQEGTNTIEITQASVTDLPIDVSYGSKKTVISFSNESDYATKQWVLNRDYVDNTTLTTTLNDYVLSADLADVATTGDYDDLINKPTIPTIGNGTITFTQGGVTKGTFTLNQSGDTTINLDAGGSTITVDSVLSTSSTNPVQNKVITVELNKKIESISSNDVITALGYTPYNSTNPDNFITSADLPTNYVTTNTAQDISGSKTFLGEKAIYFKQQETSNKLGFTLYNPSNTELGALEYRPNTINGASLLALNCPQTTGGYVGFRYWGNPAINIIAPKPTTAGNYYIPVRFTDGTNTVTSDNTGIVNLTSLLPDLSSYQPLLVSGSNIKTINGASILGSGNLTLDGLPSQTGQNGKFLTTNGTEASWANTTKVTIRDWSVS